MNLENAGGESERKALSPVLFGQYRKQACDMHVWKSERKALSHRLIWAVSQTNLRYAGRKS